MLAHVEDTNGFVQGIRTVLKDTGVAVIEVPYIKELIDHCEFDTIYHEHLCYFSVTALDYLFRRHSLFLNEVKKIPIHGGSLRLYVEPQGNCRRKCNKDDGRGGRHKMDQIDYYRNFSIKVQELKKDLSNLLNSLKEKGNRIAAYGAAAKGSTMINYVEIGTDLIDFVVDRNTHKHGKFMPGKHLPIFDTEKLVEEMPDYVCFAGMEFCRRDFGSAGISWKEAENSSFRYLIRWWSKGKHLMNNKHNVAPEADRTGVARSTTPAHAVFQRPAPFL